MASFIVILIVIIAALLGLVILVQNPKGGGLAVGFQGSTQLGGVQRTTDFLEKATWYLAIAMFVLCLISASFYTQAPAGDQRGEDAQIEQTTTDGGAEPAPAE